MEENKNLEMENVQNQEEKSAIDFQLIYTTLILNWKWFILSIILCLGLGYLSCSMQNLYSRLRQKYSSRMMTKASEAVV